MNDYKELIEELRERVGEEKMRLDGSDRNLNVMAEAADCIEQLVEENKELTTLIRFLKCDFSDLENTYF